MQKTTTLRNEIAKYKTTINLEKTTQKPFKNGTLLDILFVCLFCALLEPRQRERAAVARQHERVSGERFGRALHRARHIAHLTIQPVNNKQQHKQHSTTVNIT
jgi:hypothetical protein